MIRALNAFGPINRSVMFQMMYEQLQIVLLHGLTGSKRFFAGLEGRLRCGSLKAATLSLDLPGFGENKEIPSGYELSDQLRFLTKAIEDRFPPGPLALIGHSLGGVLALAWTVQHLGRISRVILLNTPLGRSRDDIIHSLLQESFGWGSVLLKHRRMAHLACKVLRGAHILRAFRFAKPPYVSNEVFHDYAQHSWKSLSRTFDRVLLGVPGDPLIRQIDDIPILNLTGREDGEISRRAIDQHNVQNLMLPGGHLMLLEHPEATIGAIERFLGQEYPAARACE